MSLSVSPINQEIQKIDPKEKECAICLKTMSKVATLACGHSFGESCIEPWLEQKNRCPFCNTKTTAILPTDEALAKAQAKRQLLQAACDADPSKERCGSQIVAEPEVLIQDQRGLEHWKFIAGVTAFCSFLCLSSFLTGVYMGSGL